MRHNRIAITVEYGCVSLRMRFFSQNFGTIKRILPGSSSLSHREGPGTEVTHRRVIFKKYKTFSVLIYSYINTSGNWKNEKLCGNTTPAGRSVFTQFRVFPIFTSVDITVYHYGKNVLYFFYNIAQRTLTEKWREIFRVDMELYQHGS